MLLAIDIGNTNMEFGIYKSGKLVANFRLSTNRNVTSDEIGLFTSQFFMVHKMNIEDVEDVVITSVVPHVMYSISSALKKYIKKTPLIIGKNIFVDIKNEYENPAEVGADRLVNSFAAYKKYGGPLIIVDFGTATTFDVVNEKGSYMGGLIYPGIKLSLEALSGSAAKLPWIDIAAPGSVIGRNTADSMRAGVVHGYAGAVMNIIRLVEKELSVSAVIVATGGLSGLINETSKIFNHIDKSLTLDGLYMIYKNYINNKNML